MLKNLGTLLLAATLCSIAGAQTLPANTTAATGGAGANVATNTDVGNATTSSALSTTLRTLTNCNTSNSYYFSPFSGTCVLVGGSAWSSLTNATANLTLANGNYSSVFNHTSAVNWTIANTTPATSGAQAQASPIFNLCGQAWDGVFGGPYANTQDCWSFQNAIGGFGNYGGILTIKDPQLAGGGYEPSIALSNPVTLTIPTGVTGTHPFTVIGHSGNTMFQVDDNFSVINFGNNIEGPGSGTWTISGNNAPININAQAGLALNSASGNLTLNGGSAFQDRTYNVNTVVQFYPGTIANNGDVVAVGGGTNSHQVQDCAVGCTNALGIYLNGGNGAASVYVSGQASVNLDASQTVAVGDIICTSAVTVGVAHDNGSTACATETLGYVLTAATTASSATIEIAIRAAAAVTASVPVGAYAAPQRGSNITSGSSVATLTVTLPTGSVANDLALIFADSGYTPTLPTGWGLVSGASAAQWQQIIGSKVLTAADITAGNVTVTFNGSYDCVLGIVTFVGAPSIREVEAATNSVGSLPIVTSSSVASTDTAIYWFSQRNTAVPTITPASGSATTLQSATTGNGGSKLATQAMPGGALSVNGTFVATYWDAVQIIVAGPVPSTAILYSAAGTALPTCAVGTKGLLLTVSDATSPSYMGAYTSGGAITTAAICSYNGTTYSWLTH